MEKISKDGKTAKTKKKRISAEFYFSVIGVWGEHKNPGGDNSDWKLVSTSSINPRLSYYKGIISASDMLCVQIVKRKLDMRSPATALSI